MKKLAALMILVATSGCAVSDPQTPVHPIKMSKADVAGAIFDSPDTIKQTYMGNNTLDVTSMKSSDGKFATGMYRSEKIRIEITEPYGVDEFMYFLEGGVTLTSSDGQVTEVRAGEGISLPKEWTGVWDTNGYTKIWVIYSADGSGL